MLDVHPPHSPTHTWKDFFTHIATIVIGLLIAIGLEQTVEFFHHRHQVTQMEEALREESLENRHVVRDDLDSIGAIDHVVEANIVILQHSRLGSGKEFLLLAPLPSARLYAPIDAAWLGMLNSGLIPIVPRQLSGNYWKLDFTIQRAIATQQEVVSLKDTILAIEKLQTTTFPLTATEREGLLMAFSEYAQQLARLRSSLDNLDVSLALALEGKDLSIEATNEAIKSKTRN
jgi:hypothetical protein